MRGEEGIPPRVERMAAPKAAGREGRKVLRIVERVLVAGPAGRVSVLAKIDTGATRTSLDTDLAARLGLGPVIRTVRIRAASAAEPETRPVVRAELVLAGVRFRVAVAVADRKDMRYRMIVGVDVLRRSPFLIDPRDLRRRGTRARREGSR
ncbi:MAG: hypothetical protein A3K59_00635 [Euryarchaeota archaeon RBG_19FT_COMBO_69_17]|nr:MAG: hypothetical protein A3K59_00635 [Euryarchaeota archaeon RBG_19FT_COMBO_69_17]